MSDAQLCVPSGSETDLSDVERCDTQFCGSAPAAETDLGSAQCLPGAGPSHYDSKCGQREVADVTLASSAGVSGHVGTDARRVGSFGGAAQRACSAGVKLAGAGRHDVLDTAAGRAAGTGRRAKRAGSALRRVRFVLKLMRFSRACST